MDLWVIFFTGLTTGGLTCLAVQGGLLATALIRPVSAPEPVPPTTNGKKRKTQTRKQVQTVVPTGVQLPNDPTPVLLFLGCKIIAYTLLGFLLGALGSLVRITPPVQAVLQMFVGLFMITTALNMLNVHPFFRRFTIQPPKAFTRLLRNRAKSGDLFTPAILGFLTVLIPCGTTQAMMLLAISTSSPILAALIMFVFVLGTSPTFFVLGYLASRVRGKFAPVFATVTALLILALGFVSIDGGLNLVSSPLAPSRVFASVIGSIGRPAQAAEAEDVNGTQVARIVANSGGYWPNTVQAKANQPIQLRLVTQGNYSCSSIFVIPMLGIERFLQPTGEEVIELPPQQPGRIYFSCGMGMYTGVINVG